MWPFCPYPTTVMLSDYHGTSFISLSIELERQNYFMHPFFDDQNKTTNLSNRITSLPTKVCCNHNQAAAYFVPFLRDGAEHHSLSVSRTRSGMRKKLLKENSKIFFYLYTFSIHIKWFDSLKRVKSDLVNFKSETIRSCPYDTLTGNFNCTLEIT